MKIVQCFTLLFDGEFVEFDLQLVAACRLEGPTPGKFLGRVALGLTLPDLVPSWTRGSFEFGALDQSSGATNRLTGLCFHPTRREQYNQTRSHFLELGSRLFQNEVCSDNLGSI